MKISFGGIYDVRFPAGTKNEYIEKKYQQTKDFVDKNINAEKFTVVDVALKDSFSTQKTQDKLADKGIRISTPVDNPWILSEIFNFMQEKDDLVQQYVDKSKVELILNA